jgi:phosphomannomutase
LVKNDQDPSILRDEKLKVVVGRDARISGPMIHNLVVNTLIGLGIDVIDLGLSTMKSPFLRKQTGELFLPLS